MKIDWDTIFSYSTIKIVRIRDRRLGILHFSFLIGIILYILLGTIFLQKKYLAIESPIASIRTSLQAPAIRTPDLPYCTNNGNGTNGGSNSGGESSYDGYTNKPCQYWDEYLVLFPPSEESSMFITTRVTEEYQTTDDGCSLSSVSCFYKTNSSIDFYIADIERFTILLDHTLSAPTLGIQYNAIQLPGLLLDSNGNEITLPPPNVVGIKGQNDILTVQGILTAAGISSLDSQGLANKSRTIRDDGLLILCFITYSNTYTYNTNNYRYTYEFKVIEDTKYKIVEPIFTTSVENRFLFDRHGIRIVFVQNGQLGQFDFQTMLLTFVSGIGLVTVATLVVDLIATRVLPQRSKYQELKFQDSHVISGDDDNNNNRSKSKSTGDDSDGGMKGIDCFSTNGSPNDPLLSDSYQKKSY